MFGLFKAKPAPEGPAHFALEMDIACAGDELFGLVNCADHRFWKNDVGHVDNVAPGRFRMHLDLVPDHVFTLVVTEAEPGRMFAYDTQATPRTGKLVKTHERYDIVPVDGRHCTVTLSVDAWFEDGLTYAEWEQEAAMMAMGVNNSLAKLKIHAEEGVAMVRHVEALQNAA